MKRQRLLHIIRHPRRTCREHWEKEIRITNKWGKNPESEYYIIRCQLPGCGMFAIFMYVLDHLAYATDNGYIPVLDSERYKCLYKEKRPINGTKDPWRYYFEPISDIQVKDCLRYKNIILGRVRAPRYKGIYYYSDNEKNVLPSKEQIEELNGLVKRYIRFRPEFQRELDEKIKKLMNKRVLGVHVRGTDMYTAGMQHPIPTGETKDFSRLDSIIKEYNIEKVFLCTDTQSTIMLFQEHYGKKLITTDALRQKDDSGCGIHMDEKLGKNRLNNKYLIGKEIIIDMYMLAHCTVLVCGASKVAYAAMIFNHNKYEKIFYFV